MWEQNFSQYVTLVTYHDPRQRMESMLVFLLRGVLSRESLLWVSKNKLIEALNILNKISASKPNTFCGTIKVSALLYNKTFWNTHASKYTHILSVNSGWAFHVSFLLALLCMYVCVFNAVVTQLWRLYFSFTQYSVVKEKCQYYQKCTGKHAFNQIWGLVSIRNTDIQSRYLNKGR